MNLRWALDEALELPRSKPIAEVRYPREGWANLCGSLGCASGQEPIFYRGVRLAPGENPELGFLFER